MTKLRSILFLFSILSSILIVRSQISPGPLSKAHASLEGIDNCSECHEKGSNSTRSKCLECHQEIKRSIQQKRGYHASTEVGTKDCSACHSDHHGREFPLIRLNKKLFNHNLTGFKLKGTHAKQECNACHKPAFIKSDLLKVRKTTYMGLSSQCTSCHLDYHQGKLSSDCSSCHGFDSFKKGVRFNHNNTRFPLLGKHNTVSCEACHKTQTINGQKFQNFSSLSFNNCTPCHQDVHENKFGQNCKQCHTEESFAYNKSMKFFDHNKTNFKLIGKHLQVDCRECHKESLTKNIKHDQCQDCHSDYHKKEFAVKGISPDCNKCHTNDGFTPSNFTLKQHNEKFKLDGAHLATSCVACHKKQDKWTFRNIGKQCVDCHTNVHKGMMRDKFIPNEDCAVCHLTSNWTEVKFNHSQTSFALTGKHSTINCSSCHYAQNEKGQRTQQFTGLSMDCGNCHKDSHVGQFAENGKTDCNRCHGTIQWKADKFNHDSSRFKLDGAHKNVKCEDCHKAVMDEKGKYIQYKFKSIDCSVCHS